jgi:NTE family protein
MKKHISSVAIQRALVLQGGGSLGAYEAGGYQALYERITKADREKGVKGKPLFNIVAGTSIGAINAAIIVSYVVENNTWEDSSERLNEFWEYLSKESLFDKIPGFTAWWEYLHNNVHTGFASGEAARRYYSAMEFSITVFSPLIPLVDTRFFNPQNIWYHFVNTSYDFVITSSIVDCGSISHINISSPLEHSG